MSLDPLKATKNVVDKYISYLETTFAFSDKELHSQLMHELRQPGKFAKGPILEATPPFEGGCSVEDFINEGVLSAQFRLLNVPELPVERNLYLHQEQAVRKLVTEKRNIIVSTGTGSGKTETFLLPILNHLFRQKEQGKLGPGVRALLLYPMNALANDQLKRLRKLLKNYPDITFGSYTGETEHSEQQAVERFRKMYPRERILENELLSRDQMKETPPHILLTNYAMLEYLLLRPNDNVFFDGDCAQDWRFIVIDEAHTYAGAKGIEMAMLLRRLKDRVVLSEAGELQCIGTSATLGGEEKDFSDVARFGSGLFGETFEWVPEDNRRQDVVTGTKKNLTIAVDSWGTPSEDLYNNWVRIVNEEEDKIAGFVETGRNFGVPNSILEQGRDAGGWVNFLYSALAGDSRLIALQEMLEQGPCFLDAAAGSIFPRDIDGQKQLVDLVHLANKARLHEGEQPLLPTRYHLFIRAIEGGYVSLLPQKRFFLDRYEWLEKEGIKYPVFEAATCRRCNSLYFSGETQTEENSKVFKQLGRQFYENKNSLEYYLILESGEPVPDNEDEMIASGEVSGGEKFLLCGLCGAIGHADNVEFPCNCGAENYFSVIKVPAKDGNVHKCPACGSTLSVGSIVRRFMLGADAVTSVLGTALYQQIPEREEDLELRVDDDDDEWGSVSNGENKSNRRLLIFSDSRQDAAFFATYLQNSYNQILHRRLIVMTLEQHWDKIISNNWRVGDLADSLKRILADLNLYPDKSSQALEAEAWKWVLNEFMAMERIGLEGLGLLGFTPVLPPGWDPPRALLGSPWHFSKQEATELIMVLLDSMRKNSAVLFPDSVSPKDEYFSPRNREYFFKENVSVSGRIYSWLPSNEHVNNTRLDYLLRLAQAAGSTDARAEAINILTGIWVNLLIKVDAPWQGHFSSIHDGNNGAVFRLRPEYWELRPAGINNSVRWYQCDKCRHLTLHNIRGICPTYRCGGKLSECDPNEELADNHYRRLYLETLPLSMQAVEHTAQLTSERASEIQKEFYDGKVNILSCSTTFELGVDVGDLETVFMRNVPPTAANYIQRAGRAGRRTSSTAYVLTFAQRRSHDFSHYAEPLRIIRGEIRPPYIGISNDKIVRRHIYAVVIALFWRLNRQYYGRVKEFFNEEDSATLKLADFLRDRPKLLELALYRIVPKDMWDKMRLQDWGWVKELLGVNGVLSRSEAELVNDLTQLRALESEYKDAGNYRRALVMQRIINTIENRNILSFLSQRNIIPKYGFPVDVVELQLHHHGDEAKGLELSRDLKIALSEYAPGSQVVAGGRLWTSRYLKKLPDREPIKYSYAICQHCGRYRSSIADIQDDLDECICGERVGRNKGTFITPEFGFIAGPPAVPGMTRPQRSFSTRKFFSQAGNVEREHSLELGGIKIMLLTGTDGKLAVINNAGQRGFKICNSCGYAEINSYKPIGNHKTPWGKDCKGRSTQVSLGYEFKTDILQLWFPDYYRNDEGFWESLLYGLLEGVGSALDIDRQDIDGTLFPYNGNKLSPAIVLFDDVPGGAGHVKRIAEGNNLQNVISRALQIAGRCECGGEQANSSCYGCLRSYSNQYCHDILNRGYVIDFLGKLVSK